MVETINVPAPDRFQIVTEHPAGIVYDAAYLGVKRTDDIIFIQITLNQGRSVEMKKALYRRMAELLTESPGVEPGNVTISLIEVPKENWSFGNGVAQYA